MKALTSPKDFGAGLIYCLIGAAALWIGSEYRLGSAGRMGPGYFPLILATILFGLGVICIVRGFFVKGTPITTPAWRALLVILAGCALFGFALPRLGLGIALFLLCMVSATASREFRLEARAIVGLLALIVVCALVFVKGLGVPMPLLGSWLEPVLGDALPWLR